MQQVAASDSDFRDCQERIQALESGEAGPPTAAGSEEMFESFDDLIADTQGESDAEDDADESPMESYETFDDLCDEVEAEMDARDEAERASDIPPDATDEIPAGFSSEELPLDEGDDATGEFVAAGQGETAEFAPPSLSEVTTGEFVDPEEDVETGELVVEAEDETPVPETVTDPGEDAPAKPKAGKRKRKISFV